MEPMLYMLMRMPSLWALVCSGKKAFHASICCDVFCSMPSKPVVAEPMSRKTLTR